MASVAPPTTRTAMSEAQQILCPKCYKPNLRRAKFCQHCAHDMVLNNDGPRYYITRVIKAGGQGSVFETIGDDGKVYAVKEMIDNFTNPKDRTEAVDRFEAEAKMLRRLSHVRIPKVYADFKDEERQYLAMEYVRGEDMEEVIRKHPGGLPEQQVLEWADEICDVLGYLHNHKPEPIIFRDMKPSNVMIEPDGKVKLIDFGIAKVFQRAERGTQIGTPGYAPPEQYQGLATVESDIYALAATLHHMLTGRDPRDEPPFSFPPVYGLKPTISKRTSEALQKALQMNPDDRFQSIGEFGAALRPPAPQVRVSQSTTVLTPQPQVAAPAAPATRPSPPAQQSTQPAVQARPAAPAVPIAAPIAAPTPQAQPRRRGGFGSFIRGLLVLLVVLGLIGATLVFAFPSVVDQYLPGVISAPQPTAAPAQRIYVPAGTFTLQDQEIIVPAGKDVREAYQEAFIQLARNDPKYGSEAITSPNAPPAFIGAPEQIGQEAQGTRYRATMQGLVYVPKS
ncbi:MAG: serine/threonine-protein kinase [Chloroflexota bacterium]|nr:serine/threonine-protein kinase [Chloroflexota bacterium]